MGNAELNGVAQAVAEQFRDGWPRVSDQIRGQLAGDIAALVTTAQAAQDAAAAAVARAGELAARVLEQDQVIAVLRTENQALASARDQLAGQVEAAANQVGLLDSRSQAAAEVAGHANALAAEVQRGAPAALAVDGARLVLRCADGRELAANLPAPDPAAVALLVIERHLDVLRGDKGDPGDKGDKGDEAAPVIDLDELASVLRAAPEFVDQVRGQAGDKGDKGDKGEEGAAAPPVDLNQLAVVVRCDAAFVAMSRGDKGDAGDKGDRGEPGPPGAPCEPWTPGVHRVGVRRSHFIGRVYEATADTSAEPGDSPDWRRIDTVGMRHIGTNEPGEPGDIHVKERATFLFDGARNWLLCAKAFTDSDAERLFNPLLSQLKGLRDRLTNNEARAHGIADLARAADANANEALRWITQRAPAIDQLLEG